MRLTHLFNEGSNWHTDPEQQSMDATRRARLGREREPEGSDAIDARLAANNNARQEYAETGRFWLKQKDTQQHLNDQPYTGKAAANAAALELLKQQPELRGNLVVTAYGPGEQQVTEGKVKELGQDLKDKALSDDDFKKKYSKTRAEVRAAMREKPVAEGVLDWAKEKYHDYQTGRQWNKFGKAQRKGDAAGMQAAQDAAAAHRDKLQVARQNRTGSTLSKDSSMGVAQDVANLKALKAKGVAEGALNELAPGGSEGNGPFDYGSAIVRIGQDFVDFYNDEGAGADAAAIIKVGQTFMSAGMAAGIRAFYAMDTQLRDHVAEQLADEGFNVKQDIYEPHSKAQTAPTAGNGTQTILALLKEFVKTRKEPEDREIVAGIYKAFQQGMEPGFVALYQGAAFDIDADFYKFARSRGVDPDKIAAQAGLDTDDIRESINEAPGAETLGHNQSTVASNLNSLDLGEGSGEQVGFSVDSERAYQAVMSRFGDMIDQDQDSGVMYAPARLWPKIEQVAYDADGIGAQRDDDLENPEHYGVKEGEKVGNMDADRFDAAMARLKQLAGAGPMKTVYDPDKRVYRNVPTAVQPSTKK